MAPAPAVFWSSVADLKVSAALPAMSDAELARLDAEDFAAFISLEAASLALSAVFPASLRASEKSLVRSENVPCVELIASSSKRQKPPRRKCTAPLVCSRSGVVPRPSTQAANDVKNRCGGRRSDDRRRSAEQPCDTAAR